jgi:hypothetical protein
MNVFFYLFNNNQYILYIKYILLKFNNKYLKFNI